MISPLRRILLVEDHEDTRDLFTLLLSDHGYAVETAATMNDAMEQLQAQSFGLLMFDSNLPDGSGLELCRRVRKFDQNTPILFCSGAAYAEDKQTALDAGAQAYLVKPIETQALVDSVESLVNGHGSVGDGQPSARPTEISAVRGQ